MTTFKENWNKVDETCPNCGTVTKRVRGITRQNIKRLLIPKWNMTEVLITFMMIMIIVLAYSYLNETKQCREWIKPMFAGNVTDCENVCSMKCQALVVPQNKEREPELALPNITIAP